MRIRSGKFVSWIYLGFCISCLSAVARLQTDRPIRTIANLNASLQGEANTSNRYYAFAVKADKEGCPQVAKLFRAVARSEAIHQRSQEAAVRELGGRVASFTLESTSVGTTRENLESVIRFEKQENTVMYPEFIRQARRDGANEAAVQAFADAHDVELQHVSLFKDALTNLGKNRKMDYYVNMKTGETVERSPDSRAPASSEAGAYVKTD